jgi:hypothetical protein
MIRYYFREDTNSNFNEYLETVKYSKITRSDLKKIQNLEGVKCFPLICHMIGEIRIASDIPGDAGSITIGEIKAKK